jgi:hypothetical protein
LEVATEQRQWRRDCGHWCVCVCVIVIQNQSILTLHTLDNNNNNKIIIINNNSSNRFVSLEVYEIERVCFLTSARNSLLDIIKQLRSCRPEGFIRFLPVSMPHIRICTTL